MLCWVWILFEASKSSNRIWARVQWTMDALESHIWHSPITISDSLKMHRKEILDDFEIVTDYTAFAQTYEIVEK